MEDIFIKCPDGFINQLRLSLASNLLVKKGSVQTATQEWILNNHNIVDYNKFYDPLPFLKFDKIKEKEELKIIYTQSFYHMIENLISIKNSFIEIFNESYQYLKIKKNYQNIFDKFIKEKNVAECIGLHIRTGCKAALLAEDKHREQLLSHDTIIDILKKTKEKIYLATDNAETQNKFLNIFKDRIIYFEKLHYGKENFFKKYDRNLVKRYTTDLHAVADFHILQKCKNFIGSNESSFSIMIKFIRNNKNDYPLKGIL